MTRCARNDLLIAPLHSRSLLRSALQLLRFCDRGAAGRAFGSVRDRVEAEWRLRQADPWWDASPAVETIYFGGGTPSHVEPAAIGRILRQSLPTARLNRVRRSPSRPIPMMSPPPTQRVARELGINRISLGVQSFDPQVLAWMHRTHTRSRFRSRWSCSVAPASTTSRST
jgi:hypothetical protein